MPLLNNIQLCKEQLQDLYHQVYISLSEVQTQLPGYTTFQYRLDQTEWGVTIMRVARCESVRCELRVCKVRVASQDFAS